MAKKDVKHIGLRVSQEVHDKVDFIAKYEGRSLNGQVYYLMLKCIREFEKEHGPIDPNELS